MMKDDLFMRFTEANGIPGHEHTIRRMMVEELRSGVDEFLYDRLGSVIGKKSGVKNGPKVMLSGHMDEVGFIITKIEDDGFLRVQPVGSWWSQVVLAHQVNITTADGTTYLGVTGAKPPQLLTPEERNKPFDIKDLFIDIGVKDKSGAEELGIQPGDAVTPYMKFRRMADEKFMLAKAWDNRVGCLVAIEVIKALKGSEHPNELYAVGTVQEEVGCRGAVTASNLINPDIAIAVDVTIGDDTPGGGKAAKLGEGPCVIVYDSGLVGHRGLREWIVKIARENSIPYQLSHMSRGETDSSRMQLAHDGAPAVSLCIPARYIHSHTSIIHSDDFDNCVSLIVAIMKKLDNKEVSKITYGAFDFG